MSLLVLVLMPANAAPNRDDMLKLKINGAFWGPSTIYMSRLGIRIRERLGDSLLIAARPEFGYWLNPENRSFLEMSIGEFVSDLRDDVSPIKRERASELEKISRYPGFNTMQCSYYATRAGRELKTADFIFLKNTTIPSSVQRVWRRVLGLENTIGDLPITCNQIVIKNWILDTSEKASKTSHRNMIPDWIQVLTCSQVQRVPLEPQLFMVPTGYRKARDKAAFSLSTDGDMSEKDLEDFFRAPIKKSP